MSDCHYVDINSQKASYDAFANHYRKYSINKKKYIDAINMAIIDEVSSVEAILDFGAGDGVRGAYLKRELRAKRLVQADISQQMLNLCRGHQQADLVIDNSKDGWEENIGKFDLILSLWNVIGHIPSHQDRVSIIKKIKNMLSANAYFIFDVNNRHNECYGKLVSLYRRVLDNIVPDNSRGDAHFQWRIDDKYYPAYGHLFTCKEVMQLLSDAGFHSYRWLTVDYSNGSISHSVNKGQLLFICRR
ncbi:class I SAM-dependent methyltransferase [Agarilytica rhodophyticola]|uniref:methyltransferase n=1 Tax=Agarilytica rhodophyticola TaxID=1737490 RepID=UPI000B342244|nr:class I SAM-dependent methyltransferase [Agarilytica rhodophyticola]